MTCTLQIAHESTTLNALASSLAALWSAATEQQHQHGASWQNSLLGQRLIDSELRETALPNAKRSTALYASKSDYPRRDSVHLLTTVSISWLHCHCAQVTMLHGCMIPATVSPCIALLRQALPLMMTWLMRELPWLPKCTEPS